MFQIPFVKREGNYYNQSAQKFIDPTTNSRTFLYILKTFINGKKIPLIPQLNVGNKQVTDFKEKARLFNEFFESKCTPIPNDGLLTSF